MKHKSCNENLENPPQPATMCPGPADTVQCYNNCNGFEFVAKKIFFPAINVDKSYTVAGRWRRPTYWELDIKTGDWLKTS